MHRFLLCHLSNNKPILDPKNTHRYRDMSFYEQKNKEKLKQIVDSQKGKGFLFMYIENQASGHSPPPIAHPPA